MITATNIINAISRELEALQYPIKDVDIEKEIPRPCLVVEADGIENGQIAGCFIEETIHIVVYYFAQRREKGYAELLRCQNDLKHILRKPLTVDSRFAVTVDNVEYEFNKSDMVLIAMFDIYTVQELPEQEFEENTELMEELDLRGEKMNDTWNAND